MLAADLTMIDINTGFNSSNAGQNSGFTTVGNKLFFSASDATSGTELRWIDTTNPSPTINTVDTFPGALSSTPGTYGGLAVVGSKLFYNAFDQTVGSELRWIDTSLATPVVNTIDIFPGSNSSDAGRYEGFKAVGDKLYFSARDATNGYELRWIDTTLASPIVNLVNLYTGPRSAFADETGGESSVQYGGFTALGDKLFFTARDAASGMELRWIDTTAASPTVNTVDTLPGALSSDAGAYGGIAVVGSKLFYNAFDRTIGAELRWIDSSLPTPIVNSIDIFPGSSNSDAGRYEGFKAVGSKLYFSARDSNGYELRWIDTSLASPIVNLVDIYIGPRSAFAEETGGASSIQYGGFTTVGDKLFFTARDAAAGMELRWIDTTIALATVNTVDTFFGALSSSPGVYGGITVVDNKMFYNAFDTTVGSELRWIDTSLPSPFVNTIDIFSGKNSSEAGRYGGLKAVGNKLFFSALVSGLGVEFHTLALSPPNSPPTAVVLAPTSAALAENTNTGSAIELSTITITDDGSGTNTLSLSGADASSFEIVGNKLRLKAGVSLDFETKSSYSVRVNVDDTTVGTTPDAFADFTITITDVNEPPTAVVLTSSSASLAENTSTSSAIEMSTTTITDDSSGTNTLSLSGTDASSFEIVGNKLRLKAGVSLDFETKSSYSVRVNVDDTTVGTTPDAFADFTLTITNVVDVSLNDIEVQNGQSQRSFIRNVDMVFSNGGADLLDLISNNRITLRRFDPSGNGSSVSVPLPALTVSGNKIQIDFGAQGVGGNRNSNLADGLYQLAIDNDGDGSADATSSFHRLLGDLNGDRVVNVSDKTKALSFLGLAYSPEADANGDGVVNSADLSLLSRAIGRRINQGL